MGEAEAGQGEGGGTRVGVDLCAHAMNRNRTSLRVAAGATISLTLELGDPLARVSQLALDRSLRLDVLGHRRRNRRLLSGDHL